jgi:hypothetical protein
MFRKALIKHTHTTMIFKHDKSLKQFKIQTFTCGPLHIIINIFFITIESIQTKVKKKIYNYQS